MPGSRLVVCTLALLLLTVLPASAVPEGAAHLGGPRLARPDMVRSCRDVRDHHALHDPRPGHAYSAPYEDLKLKR
jgi:hypothetical protein